MQHTVGNLKRKAADAIEESQDKEAAEKALLQDRMEKAALQPSRKSLNNAAGRLLGSISEDHELDIKRTTKRLLKYIVKSQEVKMMEDEYANKLKTAAYNVFIMIIFTACLFGLTNEWRFVDCFWFAFVTLSTIGYGDFTPGNTGSRLVFVIVSKIGLGTMTLFLAEMVDYANRQREVHRQALERVRKAEMEGLYEGKSSTLDKRMCCGLLPPLKSDLQKSGYKALKAMVSFFVVMLIGALSLVYSEGWLYVDGVYFAFQTSSTIGYGDQGALYNYFSKDTGEAINWGEVTIGHNASLGEVPPDDCTNSYGTCIVSEDGQACECTFSDGAKLMIVLYFLMSAGSLAVLFDASLAYAEALRDESKVLARRISQNTKNKASQFSKNLSNSKLTRMLSRDDGDTDNGEIEKGGLELPVVEPGSSTKIVPEGKPRARRKSSILSESVAESLEQSRRKCYQTPCFRLSGSIFGCGMYMLFGALIFYSIEKDTFSNLFEAYYFCAISLTTIGYGDFCVTQPGSKVFLIFYCILGVAMVTKFLTSVQKEMRKVTKSRVACAQNLSCCKEMSQQWTDSAWLVIIVSIQALIFYTLGLALFLLFECAAGQEGNFFIEGDMNGTSWASLDVLLFYNSVTTTTIGYGANFYPRTSMGQLYMVIFSWFALGNTFFLIDAITEFVKNRAVQRWEIRAKDLMLTTGLSELEDLLHTSEKEDENKTKVYGRLAWGGRK